MCRNRKSGRAMGRRNILPQRVRKESRSGRFPLSTQVHRPMMKRMFSQIRSVHFVGICGTAMASAAAALKEKGVQVTGSDQNVYPPMSTFLLERKIQVIPGYAEVN